jgi:putative ABC transport system ATP-binding protein
VTTAPDALAQLPPPPVDAAARTVGATKVYGSGSNEIRALDEVTVAFERGRFTAIMGPSGSGKSTLMQTTAGLDRLTSGQAFIGATDITRLNPTQLTILRREQIGFVFQSFNLIPTLTAEENILLPLTLAKREVDAAYYESVVSTVGLGDRLGHTPSELSGGQQQRVAVARALVSRPAIVFADEPTGNLDSHTGDEILQFMRDAVDTLGQSVVMVTHDPLAAAFADLVLFLADGRIVDRMDEPTHDGVLDRMKSFRT